MINERCYQFFCNADAFVFEGEFNGYDTVFNLTMNFREHSKREMSVTAKAFFFSPFTFLRLYCMTTLLGRVKHVFFYADVESKAVTMPRFCRRERIFVIIRHYRAKKKK